MNRSATPFLVTLTLALPAGAVEGVDTSDWACEYCPFEEGVSGSVEAGIASVSDDAAYLGSATGYDEDGLYPNLDARGMYADGEHRVRWDVEDLGLDSRRVEVRGREAGRLAYRLDWQELPFRQFFTTSSVFTDASQGDLVLPEDWVSAPTTQGFSALEGSLSRRNLASDRRDVAIGGAYALTPAVSVNVDFRQRSKQGTRSFGGSTYTNASLLPARFDHTTDEVEVGAVYGTERTSAQLSWFLSDFDNAFDSLGWEQPFTTAPGAGSPALARAPDNRFQQLRLSGGHALPSWNTVVNATAAIGRIEQDVAFLPYTTNDLLEAGSLPRQSLAGEVDTRTLAISVNSRPARDLRLRASYRYAERENDTPQALYSRVIVDTFPSGEEETNRPFSYRRRNVSGSADWDVVQGVRLSSGFEFKQHDRTLQEVSRQDDFLSYGRARLRPISGIEFDVRYGNSRREIDNYDEALAVALGQNPLLRKYNLAYRFREFVDLRASITPADLPLSVTVSALLADDSYTQSTLGLTGAEETSFAADLSWSLSKRAALFVNAGIDGIEATQRGSEALAGPDWRARNDDRFTSLGGGLTVNDIAGKFDLRVSAMSSQGESRIDVASTASGADRFPDLTTDLKRLRMDLSYRHSDAMEFSFRAVYQRFESGDWALEGVSPAAVPQLLSLGAQPYDEENVVLLFGVNYRMGSR